MGTDGELPHRLRGAIDADALFTIREAFTRHAPLASARVDDLVRPSVLTVELTDGLQGESGGRFDVQWTTEGDYKVHYTEEGLDFRWGSHPHGGDYDVRGAAHFHPPPTASSDPGDVEASCFTVHQPALVARGVLTNWRAAYHGGLEALNQSGYTR